MMKVEKGRCIRITQDHEVEEPTEEEFNNNDYLGQICDRWLLSEVILVLIRKKDGTMGVLVVHNEGNATASFAEGQIASISALISYLERVLKFIPDAWQSDESFWTVELAVRIGCHLYARQEVVQVKHLLHSWRSLYE